MQTSTTTEDHDYYDDNDDDNDNDHRDDNDQYYSGVCISRWVLVTGRIYRQTDTDAVICTVCTAQTYIYSMLDAVPPIHAESSHVATDKDPSK